MDLQWIAFAGVLILNTLAALSITARMARRRRAPGSRTIAWMFVALAVWTFGYAMITLSPSLEAKHFWLKIENVGIVSVPVLWFIFAMKYTKLDKRMTPPARFVFWVVPFVTLVLLFSERWFDLYYTFTKLYAENGGPLTIGRGPWYWVQLVQNYLLIAVGTILLLWHIFLFRDVYRKRIFTVLGAIVIPWILNTFYQLGSNVLPSFYIPIDLTPIAFTLSAGLISFSIFGQQLFDIIPVARHTVMENIPEMVLVIDAQNRILDANRAALAWMGKSAEEIIGQDVLQVFSAWPKIAAYYEAENTTREEFQILGDSQRTIELVIAPLYSHFGDQDGRVVVAHDVTKRKQMETALKAANESLKAQLSKIESLQAQLREQVIRDPLTGLFNRRYLAEALDVEVARAERDKTPISAIIMDVDYFKDFNDTYGHKCGDQVLQYLGELLLENTRRGDIVCRYGGEEFVILMPKVDLEVAARRAESWRQAFETAVIDYEKQQLSATFSVGVANFPLHAKNGEDLLKAADQALYRSKANGRNRVTVCQGAESTLIKTKEYND
ncbi:MAG: diguanylate cyclase [Chloroflexi bacterium]|nr:diguanylate cyclase [Chloroflexota bacterium]